MDFSFTIDSFDATTNYVSVTYTSTDGTHDVITTQVKVDPDRADDLVYVRGLIITLSPVRHWREQDAVAALASALDLTSFTDLVNGTDLDVSTSEVDTAFPTS